MAEAVAAGSPLNILVTGMHRSGTSAIGLALARAGVSAGVPGHETKPGPENPAGFAERRDVVAFDKYLVHELGWYWDAPPAQAPDAPPSHPDLVRLGRKVVREAMPKEEAWFIKDPRLSLLLPWWRKILLDRFVTVIPMRSTEEVVWSLHVRNDLPLPLGATLTAAYYRHLATGLSGLPVIVVDYAALADEPETVAAGLFDALAQAGVRGAFDRTAAAAAVDPALRRVTMPSRVTLDEMLSPQARRLISAWPSGAVEYIPRFALRFDAPAPWEEALLDLQRRLRAAEEAQRDSGTRLGKARGKSAAVPERQRTSDETH